MLVYVVAYVWHVRTCAHDCGFLHEQPAYRVYPGCARRTLDRTNLVVHSSVQPFELP